MSAYAGQPRTGQEDGGGFFAGGSQQGSQAGNKSADTDRSLRPLTIKQSLDAEEAFSGADFKVDGHPLAQVTVVGQVRSVNPQSTNVTYRLDDGTGQIDVKKWVDSESPPGDDELKLEDVHIRVHGILKSSNNRRFINASNIRRITDQNEVNYHMLESTYVHLYFTKGPLNGANGAPAGQEGGMFVGDGGANYSNGAGDNPMLARLSPLARKIHGFLSSVPAASGHNDGAHVNVIANSIGVSATDVLKVADELLNQGLMYTTADEETWAV